MEHLKQQHLILRDIYRIVFKRKYHIDFEIFKEEREEAINEVIKTHFADYYDKNIGFEARPKNPEKHRKLIENTALIHHNILIPLKIFVGAVNQLTIHNMTKELYQTIDDDIDVNRLDLVLENFVKNSKNNSKLFEYYDDLLLQSLSEFVVINNVDHFKEKRNFLQKIKEVF